MTPKQKIDNAFAMFRHAFYSGRGTATDKCQAAYECSIVYEMIGNGTFAHYFEQIGNYWYMQQDKFKTIVHEED